MCQAKLDAETDAKKKNSPSLREAEGKTQDTQVVTIR